MMAYWKKNENGDLLFGSRILVHKSRELVRTLEPQGKWDIGKQETECIRSLTFV